MKRWLVRLYPRAWRRRYGAEFQALLEQQALSPEGVVDVLRGALDAHTTAWQQGHTFEQARPEHGGKWDMERKRQRSNCSFCGKSQEAVRRLIGGPGGIFICDECIDLCNQIIAEEEHMSPTAQGGRPGNAGRRRTASWWKRLLSRNHWAGRKHRALLLTSTG